MATLVKNVRIKDGKLVRIYRMDVSRKIGNKAKADRKEIAWRKKSRT